MKRDRYTYTAFPVKVVLGHDKTSGPHDMVCLEQPVWRDRACGYRSQSYLWLKLVCNDPECRAICYVPAFDTWTEYLKRYAPEMIVDERREAHAEAVGNLAQSIDDSLTAMIERHGH